MAKRRILALIAAAAMALSASLTVMAEPSASYPICSINFDDGSTQGVYPTGNSTHRLDSSNYVSEDYSLQILNRTETWNAAEWDLTGKMTPGNTYRFSAWVYHESDETVTFQFSFKINEGENYTYCRQQEVAPNTWTYVMGKYTVGEDEVSVKPYIEQIDNTDPFWVDDISVVQTGGYRVDSSIEADIVSLKDAFEDTGVTVGTSIGSAVMAGDVTGEQKELIVKHFDSIAIENQLKAQFVLDYDTSVSDLNKYNTSPALDFSAAKPFFDFAKENDLKITAQALVWYSMTPDWFFYEDYDTSKSFAGREVMLLRLENYIKGVLTWCEDNYPGIITSWIVVNEAVNDDIPTPSVRNDNFRKTIGDDYIAKAFEYAHKYRPNSTVRYLYNDYNMEYYWEKVQFALDYLEDCGAIDNGWVDGIGFQCHIRMDWPGTNHIKDNCARVAAAGLEAEVTEIDISLRASEVATYASEFEAFYAQRLRYKEVIEAFMDAKEAGLDLKNITWWGLTDGYTWLTGQYNEPNFPMLFDANNKAKPAFYGVLDGIGYSEPLTNLALNKETGEVGHQDNHPKELANDGDLSTRWAGPTTHDGRPAPYEGEYWWWVDLGEEKTFNSIIINWEVCFGKNFVIQTADSNPENESSWTDVTEAMDGLNGAQAIVFEEAVTARYVRMFARAKNTDWGCSMYEFSVYYDPSVAAGGESEEIYIGEDTEDVPLSGTLEDLQVPPGGVSAKIIKQPKDVSVVSGEKARVTFKAAGDGLTYEWYVKNKGEDDFVKSSVTASTYSYTMTAAKSGRQVYCVITDRYNKSVTTDTVTLRMKVSIKTQPDDVYAERGKTAKAVVIARGEGLTYQWYVKDVGDSEFKKSSVKKTTYSYTMTSAKSGRQAYCVITDKYGNSVTTETITFTAVKEETGIVAQPSDVRVKSGEKAKVTFKAAGDGLTYQWYVKDVGDSGFKKSSVTKASYSYTMTSAKSGRQVYCVITDKYGNSVTTETVTLTMS